MLLKVLRPSGAATGDCTCVLSRRGERILELLNNAHISNTCAQPGSAKCINSPCPSYTFSLSLSEQRASESWTGLESRSMNVLR